MATASTRKAVGYACVLLFLLLSTLAVQSEAAAKRSVVNCDACTRTGQLYVCRTPFNSYVCTQKGSDAVCNSDTGCVCCNDAPIEGCSLCDIGTDEYENDEELFEGVVWPSSLPSNEAEGPDAERK